MLQKDFSVALQAAQEELADAIQARDLWNKRILQLEQTVRNLSTLTAQQQIGNRIRIAVEFNDAILMALRSTGQPMRPIEIRDALVAMGFEMRTRLHFSNPMSALHNALGRLEKKGLIMKLSNGAYRASY